MRSSNVAKATPFLSGPGHTTGVLLSVPGVTSETLTVDVDVEPRRRRVEVRQSHDEGELRRFRARTEEHLANALRPFELTQHAG